jgi:uncharacterized coiled-coil DUF342 family protein
LVTELQQVKEKHLDEKSGWLKEADTFKHAIDDLKEMIEVKKLEIAEISMKFTCSEEKIINYEKEILMRT